ncbi:hypothetical protein CL619_01740 [archaeon]|nr:hypothetical protein [archaeon]
MPWVQLQEVIKIADEMITNLASLTDLVIERYEQVQHLAYGTLVGTAYHFDGSMILDNPVPTAPYQGLIPWVFEAADSLEEPRELIPKTVSLFGHYHQLFLLNRGFFDEQVLDILRESSYGEIALAEEILTDKKLLRDAAANYVTSIKDRRISGKVDFVDFLMGYNVDLKSMHSRSGSYQHLLGRLFFRFGEEDFEESLLSHAGGSELERAAEIHKSRSVEHKIIDLNTDLSDLAAKLSPNRVYLPTESKPAGNLKIKIPGLHRVRVPGGDGIVNWSSFARERRTRQLSYATFAPEEVLAARVNNILTEKALEYLKAGFGIEEVREGLASMVAGSESGETALTDVMDTVEIMLAFDTFESINHEMPVTIVNKR